jgi:hypothetical protein
MYPAQRPQVADVLERRRTLPWSGGGQVFGACEMVLGETMRIERVAGALSALRLQPSVRALGAARHTMRYRWGLSLALAFHVDVNLGALGHIH